MSARLAGAFLGVALVSGSVAFGLARRSPQIDASPAVQRLPEVAPEAPPPPSDPSYVRLSYDDRRAIVADVTEAIAQRLAQRQPVAPPPEAVEANTPTEAAAPDVQAIAASVGEIVQRAVARQTLPDDDVLSLQRLVAKLPPEHRAEALKGLFAAVNARQIRLTTRGPLFSNRALASAQLND